MEEFETTVTSYEEVLESRRMFGHPDLFLRVAVADQAAYEAFLSMRRTMWWVSSLSRSCNCAT